MYRIGVDVGSTYTKYCIMKDRDIESLSAEKTPLRQKEYFEDRIRGLRERYGDAEIISCGYGKNNVSGMKSINELTALAAGGYHMVRSDCAFLDVGGQDTKIIYQKKGRLMEFFLNDKCAAGSGMFLSSTLDMLGLRFEDIALDDSKDITLKLSSTCAVFAQSEIVSLIADNHPAEEIIEAVLWQIFVKAKPLVSKLEPGMIVLSGGLSRIQGIAGLAGKVTGRECRTVENGMFLASIGCALS